MTIIQKPASEQNYTRGRAWPKVDFVVLHLEAGSEVGSIAWFANPAAQVSAHYSVSKAGTVYQHVQEADTAWANGLTAPYRWADKTKDPGRACNPNAYTVSIEHEGQPADIWPDAQVQASAALVADICRRHGIPIDNTRVIGHATIGGHAACPGANCPMDQIISLAAGTVPAAPDVCTV